MRTAALLPTQCGFRMAPAQRRALADYVRDGGQFAGKPICIDRFPDGALFVRDGHHRVAAVHLNRRSRHLLDREYAVTDRSYDMYIHSDLGDGWITPFDPRTHIRLADTSAFKRQVLSLLHAGVDPQRFILGNAHGYCRLRSSLDTFERLAGEL